MPCWPPTPRVWSTALTCTQQALGRVLGQELLRSRLLRAYICSDVSMCRSDHAPLSPSREHASGCACCQLTTFTNGASSARWPDGRPGLCEAVHSYREQQPTLAPIIWRLARRTEQLAYLYANDADPWPTGHIRHIQHWDIMGNIKRATHIGLAQHARLLLAHVHHDEG